LQNKEYFVTVFLFLKINCKKGNKFEFAAFLFPVATAKVN
jgi:hypothetical protein